MRHWPRPHVVVSVAAIVALVGGAVVHPAAHQQITVTSDGPGSLPLIAGGRGATPPKPLENGTGLIFGQTVEAASSRPVSGALVTLSVAGSIPVRVLSDGDGHYAFRDVPKGGFSVTATKPGFSSGAYGRLRPDGPSQPLQLTDGQRLTDVALPMWRLGAIAGAVTDDAGEPVVGATVRVLHRTILGGRPQLDSGDSVTTDDRGLYRLGSLTPGEYVVVVPIAPPNALDSLLAAAGLAGAPAGGLTAAFSRTTSGGGGGGNTVRISSSGTSSVSQPAGLTDDGHELWFQTTFYPTALSSSHADVIPIKAGQERGDVDFTLKAVRTASIGGTLVGPEGPAVSTRVTLVPADAGNLVTPIESANAMTDSLGHFTFPPVPAGQYVLRAVKAPPANIGGDTQTFQMGGNVVVMRVVVNTSGASVPPLPTTPTLWIDTPVTVDTNDVNDLEFAMRTGIRVSGHIEFNGSATQPTPDQYPTIGLQLVPAGGSPNAAPVRGRVDPSGTFTTMGVPAGKYLLRVSPPNGWLLRGAMLGGKDLADAAVDLRDVDLDSVVITFTDKPSSLAGTVTAASGNVDPKATVIVFPQDASLWTDSGPAPRRLHSTRTGPDGSYSVSVPAGDYYAVAVSDTGSFEWNDPAFLSAIAPLAAHVTVVEGSSHQQALHTTAPPAAGGF